MAKVASFIVESQPFSTASHIEACIEPSWMSSGNKIILSMPFEPVVAEEGRRVVIIP